MAESEFATDRPDRRLAGASANRLVVDQDRQVAPDGVFEENEAYDPGADAWETLAPMPTPRHGTGAAVVGDRIHIPGGGLVEGFGVTDVHEVFELGPPAVPVPLLPSWALLVLILGLLGGALRSGRGPA